MAAFAEKGNLNTFPPHELQDCRGEIDVAVAEYAPEVFWMELQFDAVNRLPYRHAPNEFYAAWADEMSGIGGGAFCLCGALFGLGLAGGRAFRFSEEHGQTRYQGERISIQPSNASGRWCVTGQGQAEEISSDHKRFLQRRRFWRETQLLLLPGFD